MKDYFDILEYLIQQGLVRNTAMDEVDIAANLIDILPVTSRQVIQHANTRAPGHECRCDV